MRMDQPGREETQPAATPELSSSSGAAGTRTGPIPDVQAGVGLAVLREVIASARAMSGAAAAAILLYDSERDLFLPTTPSVADGLDERWLQRRGLGAAQELARRVLAHSGVQHIADANAEPGLDLPVLAGGLRPGAVTVVALTADGVVLGALELYHATPAPTLIDTDILAPFAALAGMAIRTAWAHERELSLRVRLEMLDEASKILASELSPDRILRRIVEIAVSLVGARYGALGVVGPDRYLSDFITVGLSDEERQRLGHLPRGHGLLGVLIQQGVPLRVPAIARDPRRVGFPPNHPPMNSLLGVPVRVRDQVVGDLYLTDKVGAAEFTDEDQRLVELLAAHAGVTIENARLHDQEAQARYTLQGALDSLRQQSAVLQRQAELIDLAHDAIIVRDPESRIVSWNQGASAMYGWSAGEAIGQVTHDLLGTAFPVSLEDAERSIAGRGTWEGELRHIRRDGAAISVESRQALVRDVNGTALSVLEINRDITERKRAQGRLQLLNEVGAALVSALDPQMAAVAVAERVVRGLADRCYIALLRDDGSLQIAAEASSDEAPAGANARPSWSTLARLVRPGRTLLLSDTLGAELADREGADVAAEVRRHGIASWIEVPIGARGGLLGVMVLVGTGADRRFDADDLAVSREVAARAATAVTNARLHAQVGELTQQRERARIGRDLHDGIIQDIYAASLQLEDATEDIPDEKVRDRLLAVADQLTRVIGDVRTYILGLRTRGLESGRISEAIAGLVAEADGLGGVSVSLEISGDAFDLPDSAANALVHITREALSNVRKHASASAATVRLAYETGGIRLTVSDDGRGFDPALERDEQHRGLRNLQARADEAGGTLSVRAAANSGSTVQVWLPAPT